MKLDILVSKEQVGPNTIYIAHCHMPIFPFPLEYRSANPTAIGKILSLKKDVWHYSSLSVQPVESHNPVHGHEIRGMLEALYIIPNLPKSLRFSSF